MGILPKTKPDEGLIEKIEDSVEAYLYDYLSFSSDEEEIATEGDVASLPAAPSPPASRRRRRSTRQKPHALGSDLPPKQKSAKLKLGSRKMRRLENSRFLSSLVDPEEICDDLSDMLPQAITAFTQLFIAQENMRVWNDFTEKSEHEQEAYLFSIAGTSDNKTQLELRREALLVDPTTGERGYYLSKKRESGAKNGGKGSGNIGPSPESAFRKIDDRFRRILRRNNLPLEKIALFERELVEFFIRTPDKIWSQTLEHGFDRLLIHAIAQYLALKSRSFNCPKLGGKRRTEVINPRPYFIQPSKSLAEFVQEEKAKRQ